MTSQKPKETITRTQKHSLSFAIFGTTLTGLGTLQYGEVYIEDGDSEERPE